MRRPASFLLLLWALTVCVSQAWALGANHPKGQPVADREGWPEGLVHLVNRPGRVGGFFVNANDYFLYAGDTRALNDFLAEYGRLKQTPLSVVLRTEAAPMTDGPWDKEGQTHTDWRLSVLRRGGAPDAPHDPKAPRDRPGYVLIVDVWLGETIKGEEVKVPAGVEVRYGAELSLVIRCLKEEVRRGDEVPIEFTITNRGKSPYDYMDRNYDRSGRMGEYKLTAKGEDGEAVPDPRASYPGGIGGGLSGKGMLQPGESFTRTIALGRWALIRKSGRYEVTGHYQQDGFSADRGRLVVSAPITVVVQPRTDHEMAAYIDELSAKLRALERNDDRPVLVQRLMYTCDARIIPALIESMYEPPGGFWETEALLYYLDERERDGIKSVIVRSATRRGLADGMQSVLHRLGLTPGEMLPLVERSLAPDNPKAWRPGALAAQVHWDDRFTPRLSALALDPKSDARHQALWALVWNRTDAGVAALRQLLADPDEGMRKYTADAIRHAYRYPGAKGRRLKPEDFPDEYRGMERLRASED